MCELLLGGGRAAGGQEEARDAEEQEARERRWAAAWASVDAPMGGFKESGVGRRHGAEGILRYTEAQTVAHQRWLELGPTRLLPPGRFRTVFTAALKLIRRLPGLR